MHHGINVFWRRTSNLLLKLSLEISGKNSFKMSGGLPRRIVKVRKQ